MAERLLTFEGCTITVYRPELNSQERHLREQDARRALAQLVAAKIRKEREHEAEQ